MKCIVKLVHIAMCKRAQWVRQSFDGELHAIQSLLDVGSGTGTFGELLRSSKNMSVTDVDVRNFSLTCNPPLIFDGLNLPFADKSFDAVTIIAVLQYTQHAEGLLRETTRVARSKILISQTVSIAGLLPRWIHRMEEFVEGRFAWKCAQFAGCFDELECPLTPSSYLTEVSFCELLQRIFNKWQILEVKKSFFPGLRHYFVAVEV